MLNKCEIKYILTECQNFLDGFIINKILKINLYTQINNFNKKYVELVSFLFFTFFILHLYFLWKVVIIMSVMYINMHINNIY